jgi:hypothetical protein
MANKLDPDKVRNELLRDLPGLEQWLAERWGIPAELVFCGICGSIDSLSKGKLPHRRPGDVDIIVFVFKSDRPHPSVLHIQSDDLPGVVSFIKDLGLPIDAQAFSVTDIRKNLRSLADKLALLDQACETANWKPLEGGLEQAFNVSFYRDPNKPTDPDLPLLLQPVIFPAPTSTTPVNKDRQAVIPFYAAIQSAIGIHRNIMQAIGWLPDSQPNPYPKLIPLIEQAETLQESVIAFRKRVDELRERGLLPMIKQGVQADIYLDLWADHILENTGDTPQSVSDAHYYWLGDQPSRLHNLVSDYLRPGYLRSQSGSSETFLECAQSSLSACPQTIHHLVHPIISDILYLHLPPHESDPVQRAIVYRRIYSNDDADVAEFETRYQAHAAEGGSHFINEATARSILATEPKTPQPYREFGPSLANFAALVRAQGESASKLFVRSLRAAHDTRIASTPPVDQQKGPLPD